jgi:hypothetical protein
MRRSLVALVGVLLIAAGNLAACSDYSNDIEAVRQARTVLQDQTNDEAARQIAGARGKVEWIAERPDKYADNEFIVAVTAKIERTTRAGGKRLVELQFIRNRQNQQIAFEQLTIDGQPQGLVGGALNLLLMQLE